jgi:S1-C subfamily serine protease
VEAQMLREQMINFLQATVISLLITNAFTLTAAVCAIRLLTGVPLQKRQALGVAACFATLPLPALDGWRGAAIAGEVSRPADFADVVQRVRPAVVSIWVKIEEDAARGGTARRIGSSTGSGFFISADGFAVTNAHVVKPEHAISRWTQIKTADGSTYDARLVGADPLSDLALIKVDGRNDFPFVDFAETPSRVDDWVIAIGSPFGLAGTVTTGIFSVEGCDIGYSPYDFIQIDAATNQGSSGGPTFDLDGNVIGVNTALWRTHDTSVRFLRGTRVTPGAIQQADAEDDRIGTHHSGRLVHECLDRPVGPAGPDGAEPAGSKRAVRKIVGERAYPLRPNAVPMVRAGDGEWIVGRSVERFRHGGWRHDGGRPAGGRVMLHGRDLSVAIECHPELLDSGRTKRVEAHVVGPRQHQLHRFAESLGGDRSGDGVVAVEPATESPADRIGAHHDPLLGQAKRLGEHRQHQALPLIAGMDLEDAVLLERQRIGWLELRVEHAGGGVGLFERLASVLEGGVELRVIQQKHAPARICDLPGAISRTSCSETCAASPGLQSTLTRSAARIAAG